MNESGRRERELKSYRREHAIFTRKTLGLNVPPTLL
jgi:hypothetical protein